MPTTSSGPSSGDKDKVKDKEAEESTIKPLGELRPPGRAGVRVGHPMKHPSACSFSEAWKLIRYYDWMIYDLIIY